MGKVYEALKKAEGERNSAAVAVAAMNGGSPHPEAGKAPRADKFDFINYSLSAPPAAETKQAAEDQALESAAREEMTRPARTVQLDLACIDPHLVAFYDCDPRASEQYNKLAISLIAGAVERPLKRLMIASAQNGEGRTCVTLNLACALARAKQRVLVVDTDLTRPSALRLLGLESDTGLAEAVAKSLPAGAASLKVQPYDFAVLPTRSRVENPAELLASPNFRHMLQAAALDYDFILFDSSPLSGAADCNLLLRHTDATLLVIRAGKTSSIQMARAITPLTEDDIFGVVLNRAVN
ncbi:MAG TPA: CpsD/CapB family tyrosine-protein kinase [Blastocatellia bacterium]|nr:CpsD/CapB family tyrosine-protein kinase [Blastocatellia bacterium]